MTWHCVVLISLSLTAKVVGHFFSCIVDHFYFFFEKKVYLKKKNLLNVPSDSQATCPRPQMTTEDWDLFAPR